MNYNELNDEALCSLAKSGDNTAYNLLEKRYQGLILNSIRSLFIYGDKQGAGKEDLFQEARLGFLSAIRNFSGNSKFASFAKLCVHNAVISCIRRLNKKGAKILNFSLSLEDNESEDLKKCEVVASVIDPETDYIRRESVKEITEKLKTTLSDFEFKILEQYLKGKSYFEIGKIFGKNEKAIDNAIQRTRRKIKTIFNEEGK